MSSWPHDPWAICALYLLARPLTLSSVVQPCLFTAGHSLCPSHQFNMQFLVTSDMPRTGDVKKVRSGLCPVTHWNLGSVTHPQWAEGITTGSKNFSEWLDSSDRNSSEWGFWKVSQRRLLLSRVSNNLGFLFVFDFWVLFGPENLETYPSTSGSSTGSPQNNSVSFYQFQRLNTSQHSCFIFPSATSLSLGTFSLAFKSLFIFSGVLHALAGCAAISSTLHFFDYPLSEEVSYRVDMECFPPLTDGPNTIPFCSVTLPVIWSIEELINLPCSSVDSCLDVLLLDGIEGRTSSLLTYPHKAVFHS